MDHDLPTSGPSPLLPAATSPTAAGAPRGNCSRSANCPADPLPERYQFTAPRLLQAEAIS